MTDRELIELAAKAAGYDWLTEWSDKIHDYDSPHYLEPALHEKGSCGECVSFNPLVSDADAFRLAVKLGLVVYIKEPIESSSYTVVLGDSDEELIESHGSDPYAATRRAITRAAAEIGKSMGEA